MLYVDRKAKYQDIKEKDQKELHSLLFKALTIQPFAQAEKLVLQLLEVGVPVTIKDEVIAYTLVSRDFITL